MPLGFVLACALALVVRGYDVRDFGVKGGGTTKDTAAIQAAWIRQQIGAAARVMLPPGRYVSGTIHLRSLSRCTWSPARRSCSARTRQILTRTKPRRMQRPTP
jgi:hypothetical protein